MIKAIINNYNLLTWTKNLADIISKESRVYVVIVDNNSSYDPLLEWYKSCPYDIVYLKENKGSHGGFGISPKDDFYIYTDPDLDISSIPDNWLDVLMEGCIKHNALKCGFSLEINNIPNEYILKDKATNWESQFWKNKLDDMYYNADIDTTFALINPKGNTAIKLRTNRPYTAQHIPWYITQNNFPEEYKNYLKTINKNLTHYSRWFIDKQIN